MICKKPAVSDPCALPNSQPDLQETAGGWLCWLPQYTPAATALVYHPRNGKPQGGVSSLSQQPRVCRCSIKSHCQTQTCGVSCLIAASHHCHRSKPICSTSHLLQQLVAAPQVLHVPRVARVLVPQALQARLQCLLVLQEERTSRERKADWCKMKFPPAPAGWPPAPACAAGGENTDQRFGYQVKLIVSQLLQARPRVPCVAGRCRQGHAPSKLERVCGRCMATLADWQQAVQPVLTWSWSASCLRTSISRWCCSNSSPLPMACMHWRLILSLGRKENTWRIFLSAARRCRWPAEGTI